MGKGALSGLSTFSACVRCDSAFSEIPTGIAERIIPAKWNRVVLRLPLGFTGLDLYHRLREKDDMLVSPVRHPRDLRVCLHFLNTESEFDALLERLEVYCG